MTSICIHFPDGSRGFRYPKIDIKEDDVLIHEGVHDRLVSVSNDGGGRDAGPSNSSPRASATCSTPKRGQSTPWATRSIHRAKDSEHAEGTPLRAEV
jgi:hypothetical protein